jgi:hypothetical protein
MVGLPPLIIGWAYPTMVLTPRLHHLFKNTPIKMDPKVKIIIERQLQQQEERIIRNLHLSIKTMREACDEAERAINRDGACSYSIEQVATGLTWGLANSNTYVRSAMSALNDVNELKFELLNPSETTNPQ